MEFRFGDFTLDIDSRQLKRLGVDRHLSPKGFELLRLLVENRPRALSKQEIHEHLWPAVYVSEATLSSLVAEVRGALNETAVREGFIRTVHRFGYAFQGDATEVSPVALSRLDARIRCWIVWDSGQVGLKDGEHLVGRDGDVAIWLDSPTVSRHHARIRVSGDGTTIEDLRSKNGTFLHGERLSAPAPLVDGDEITLGSVPVKFRRIEPGLSTATRSH
jgi:DNA-binding winged helix-turn-helix (wHTH) protein